MRPLDGDVLGDRGDGETGARDGLVADDTDAALVDEICRAARAATGDPVPLVDGLVRRIAPLRGAAAQHDLGRRALAQLTGLGDLDTLLRDPDVDDVLVNSGRDVWVDRRGELVRAGRLTAGTVDLLVERVLAPLGRRADRTSPIVDARLPGGARVCAVLPPIAVDGTMLSIRRFRDAPLDLDAFTGSRGATLIDAVVRSRCNVIVSGATSSGKTALVGALVRRCPSEERIVVVEDTTELPLTDRHSVRLEARPPTVDGPPPVDLAQLVRTALRMRPDRIVVGEIRGDEVVALVQALNTGHDGSLATVHANGALDALLRLEALVLCAAPTWPLPAIRHHLARSIDVVVHVERIPGSTVRRIATVDEVVLPEDLDDTTPRLRRLAMAGEDGDVRTIEGRRRGRR